MTRYIIYTLLLMTTAISSQSCKPKSLQKDKVLSVSIEPQRFFLEALVGDKFSVNTTIPAGSNPETYDPAPSQMVNIGKSAIYFKVGNMGFENTWLNNISNNNPAMTIVDCSVGIPHIHDAGHHGDCDPHIWSSPKSASIISKNMYNALIESDPQNRDYYLKNYTALEKNIQKTDSIIRSYLDSSTHKAFIIYHPALSYFADQYSLKQYSIEVDGKAPSPQQVAQLIQQARKDNVKVVFLQEEFDTKNAETIAKELNADLVSINPLSYNWDQELIKIAKAIVQNDK